MKIFNTQSITLECLGLRTFSRDMYFSKVSENIKIPQIKNHFIWVKLKDLPRNIPKSPNPRSPNPKAKPCKDMRETLRNEPHFFPECNRGLILLVEDVKFIKKSPYVINIDFGVDEEGSTIGGLVDGGHTYAVLNEAEFRNDSLLMDLPIPVSIIEGSDPEFSQKIAKARNTSVQVKEWSMDNLGKEFDPLKSALKQYAPKVIFFENEGLENDNAIIPINDVISLMTAINKDLYPNDSTPPIISYTGKGSCYKNWRNPQKRVSYEKLYSILPSILELYDYLHKNHEKYYIESKNRKGENHRYGGITGVYKDKKIKLNFLNILSHKIDTPLLIPIFSALRFLLKEDDQGNYKWSVDPKKYLDKYGPNLVAELIENHSEQCGSNPNKTGKAKFVWKMLATRVELGSKNTD